MWYNWVEKQPLGVKLRLQRLLCAVLLFEFIQVQLIIEDGDQQTFKLKQYWTKRLNP